MTLAEMRARLAEIQEELRGIHTEAGDAALTEERQGEWDSLSGEMGTLKADIARAEARQAVVAELGEKKETREGAPTFIPTRTEDEIFDLNEVRKMAVSGDDFLRKVEDNAKRAIERAKFGLSNLPNGRKVSAEEAQERAEELLELHDDANRNLAKRYLLTGSSDYERAYTSVLRHGTDAFCTNDERMALRAAQSLGTDGGGGYAVPFQLDPTVILTSAGVVNPIRELADVRTIVGKELDLVTSAGTTVARAGEAAAATASEFTLAQPKVRTNRVQGYTRFSIEIDLSWSALRSEITRMLVDAKGQEENSFWNGAGDGITDGTAPQGINAGLSGAGQDVVCGTLNAFGLADLYKLEEALDARWEDGASFAAHKTVINAIRQFPTDNAGSTPGSMNNLVVPGLAAGNPRTLLDQPLYRSTALPTLAAAIAYAGTTGDGGDTLMIYGNFKNFTIVDRIGMSTEMVQTVVNSSGFPTGQRGVFTYWMNNSRIIVPGAFKRLLVKQA